MANDHQNGSTVGVNEAPSAPSPVGAASAYARSSDGVGLPLEGWHATNLTSSVSNPADPIGNPVVVVSGSARLDVAQSQLGKWQVVGGVNDC